MMFGSAGVASGAAASIAPTSATAMNTTTQDRAEIIDTVNRIGILSDRRDWTAVQKCFTKQVKFDYTSLNGGEPTTLAAATQVQQWADFFSKTFKNTQHLVGSHAVTLNGNTATCIAHCQAHHTYLNSSKTAWLLAGTYDYELVKSSNGWKVQTMKMTALWETGDRPS